jgi:2,2-dialkylglycine decarboxylase (pyruvate)
MFAFEQHDVIPDILTISKHFGGGVSISAAITNEKIEETIVERGFVCGHSHCNDPLGCAAGVASIDLIVNDGVPQRAAQLGEYFQAILRGLAQKHELIGDVRGKGLIQGIELVEDRRKKQPAKEIGAAIHKRLLAEGLISSSRRGGSVIRFVPPVTTTTEQFDRAGELLNKTIQAALDERSRGKARGIGGSNKDK